MMRLIASAAIVGVLVAGGCLYAANGSGWIDAISDRPHAAAAHEPWPICATMTGLGSESDGTPIDPDFAAGKRALARGNWNDAIAALDLAALRDPLNADIQSYIGYAHLRLGQLGPAMGHYQWALMRNPRHRGAHTHLGELFLALDEPHQAREQLAALNEICLIPCEEIAYLARAISRYDAATRSAGLE